MDDCTDITILKPIHYGPMTVIEDPDYDYRVHSRTDFNVNDYYIRRLSMHETLARGSLGRMYETMQDIQLSCLYNGRTEMVTCPAGSILDDDSFQKIFKIEHGGLAWIFHDWLYYCHAFDVRADGIQTHIVRRGTVDDLIHTIITKVDYIWSAHRLDLLAVAQLNAKWNYFLL